MFLHRFALAALVVGASAAHGQVIFSDNFNADLRGLNKTTFVGGWTVGNGSVDVIGAGPGNAPGAGPGQPGDATGYDFLPGNGNYIDLDGSSRDSGVFGKTLTLTGGVSYIASFQLAGSQRNFMESINAVFGTTSQLFSYAKNVGFTTSTLSFTPSVTGSYVLSFAEPGPSNNEGLLLDNVTVSGVTAAVPEPSTLATMLAGLGALVFVARRRSRN